MEHEKKHTGVDQKNNVEVSLYPMGSKIKYRITGRVYCSEQQTHIPNSGTYDKSDLLWNSVFGSEIEKEKFLKKNRTIKMVLPIGLLGYDSCDEIREMP